MKLQPREQSIIGFASIAGVLIVGWFYGIDPQLASFNESRDQLTSANNTFTGNETTIANLKTKIAQLKTQVVQLPPDKEINSVNYEQGQTPETAQRDLVDTIIEMSQSSDTGNTLISVKPLPKPAPPPPPVVAPVDPNAPPAPPPLQISDFIDESPYQIAVRGNYVSINKFVNALADYQTIIEISQLEVQPEDKGNMDPSKPLRATLTLNCILKKS